MITLLLVFILVLLLIKGLLFTLLLAASLISVAVACVAVWNMRKKRPEVKKEFTSTGNSVIDAQEIANFITPLCDYISSRATMADEDYQSFRKGSVAFNALLRVIHARGYRMKIVKVDKEDVEN